MTQAAVLFPLMITPAQDTAERTRLAVQSISFAIPEIQRLEYVGKPVVFRFEDEEQKCP